MPSQTGDGTYRVAPADDGTLHCNCPDHEERQLPCKHVMAVEITVQRESNGKKVTYSELVKVTYSQDWPAYNKAQCNEKDMFVRLLADLCAGAPQPPYTTGRPRLPMSDMTFAIVYKTYVRFSSRRFTSDLRTAQADGLIARAPAFNSVLHYMGDPNVTPILSDLVQASSVPLAAIETDFAVDSSGFGTSNSRTWFSHKHGREMRAREWRKVHAIAGVRTHIITAARIGDAYSNDAPYLPELVATTAENFTLNEVSADKGYLSHGNADAIEKFGATPFIPFKSNTKVPTGDGAWERMYHLYAYHREEFLTHYHPRSNVETVFAMMKAKFGDSLLSRTETAQTNETLGKVIAHNVCVLIQSFYELGIESSFPGPELDQAAPSNVIALPHRGPGA